LSKKVLGIIAWQKKRRGGTLGAQGLDTQLKICHIIIWSPMWKKLFMTKNFNFGRGALTTHSFLLPSNLLTTKPNHPPWLALTR
jgi:hypothetical protein